MSQSDRLDSTENASKIIGSMWTMEPDDPIPLVNPQIPAIFGRVDPEKASAQVDGLDKSQLEETHERLTNGRICYAAWIENKIAAFGWVSFNEEFVGELGLRLKLLPGEAYIWDCVTLPAFRQMHLYSALLAYIATDLRGQNLGRLWIGTNLENVASQRGIARAGFRQVGYLLVSQVNTKRMMWIQGAQGVPDRLIREAKRVFLDGVDRVWMAASGSREDQV
jgi:ribosomal protein S18 acetylase RimI-like enzyme